MDFEFPIILHDTLIAWVDVYRAKSTNSIQIDGFD